MSEPQDNDGPHLAGRWKGGSRPVTDALGEGGSSRRASQRLRLPIPVRLKIGHGRPEERRLRNVNLAGLCIEAGASAAKGEIAAVEFEGYARVCDPFLLLGKVVRMTDDVPPAAVIEVDRKATGEEALGQYRKLVLHFIRNRGLLEELRDGYFEARCPACGWIGRVDDRDQSCTECGEAVVAVEG